MKRTLVKYRNSAFRKYIARHEKYAPVVFFIGGFIFDTLTLGRIDRLYDLVVLCMHMSLLSISLYLYNLADDGRWKNTFLERYQVYFPLAIQFFFGGLSSAYVVYFSRTVSLSKTAFFFVILIALLLANEFLKKRISNKYLQFGVYSFISITFFSFMIPVFIREMSTEIFRISSLASLGCTLLLIVLIYGKSPGTRAEMHLGKLLGLVLLIYALFNVFYHFRLIPPVPLALDEGIVAHHIEIKDNAYYVTYERDEWYVIWRPHRIEYIHQPDEQVYVYSSIFAPTDLEKTVAHRWQWYNDSIGSWELVEDISYEITGGRDGGFRGYTYKNNVLPGDWKVEVITEEELVIGVIDFKIIIDDKQSPKRLVQKKF